MNNGLEADSNSPEQSLCLSCGLCCDGTLFARVHLKDGDAPMPLTAGGIQIQTQDAKIFFDQSCAAYRQNCCQVYADRPQNCRSCRCELLKKYEGGAVSRTEAQSIISRARHLRTGVATELARIIPDGNRMPVGALLKITPTQQALATDPAQRKKWGALMLSLAALLDCLRTHFQPPRETKRDAAQQLK